MPSTGEAYSLTTLVTRGAVSIAFSADETRIFVARSDGNIDVFDLATQQKIATWDVGQSLGGMSLSEDGSFLLVTERFAPFFNPANPSPPGPSPSSPGILYRVDTATGNIITHTLAGPLFTDVEIVNGNTALVSGYNQQLMRFNLNDATFAPITEGGSALAVLAEDTHLTLLAYPGHSAGPMAIYDDRTGTIVAQGDNYQTINAGRGGQTGYNWGSQAISEKAGLVIQFTTRSINIFDLDLKFIRGFSMDPRVDGIAFDPSGKYLYIYNSEVGVIRKYETTNWEIVDSFTVPPTAWHNNIGYGDQIKIDSTGKYLTIMDYYGNGGRAHLIDLTIRDERFEGTNGADAFAGSKGDDVYIVNDAGDSITEFIHQGNDTVISSIDVTLAAGVEELVLTGAATRGTGNDLANILYGTDAADVLQGLGGGDRFYGGMGSDWIDGGAGDDVVYGGLDNDTLLGGDGSDWMTGEDGDDWLEGGAANDFLHGEAGDDRFYGGAGNDNIAAGAGADVAYGGAGNDILVGGDGSDWLTGEAGDDWLEGGEANDFLHGEDGDDRFYGGAGNDNIAAGAGNDVGYGGSGNDTLVGGDGSDWLTGEAEDDWLEGGSGNDFLLGESGNDRIYGGADNDNVAAGAGDDVVYGGSGNDTLSGGGDADWMTGEAGDDRLDGGDGNDALLGEDGNDTLNGGLGADALAGGAGADRFWFETQLGAGNVDLVTDFLSGTDRILLDRAAFAGLGLGALAANAFVVGTAAQDADDRILYDPSTGALFFDADGNGAGAAIRFATLDGAPTLLASDFIIV